MDYSNVCRGKWKKENGEEIDFITKDDEYTKGCNLFRLPALAHTPFFLFLIIVTSEYGVYLCFILVRPKANSYK